jgi:hypothetical protein
MGAGLSTGFACGYFVNKMQFAQSGDVLLHYVTGMFLCVAGGRLGIYKIQQLFESQIEHFINHHANSNTHGITIGQPAFLQLELPANTP